MITYEKYCEYRDLKGLKDVEVARRAEIHPGVFSEWKKGKSTPKADKMTKIAHALDMTYAEFVGIDAVPEAQKPTEQELRDIELLKKYHSAAPEIRDLIDHALKVHQ